VHVTPSLNQESLPARGRRMQAGVSELDNETSLLNQAQAGDRDAFSSLVSSQLQTLYRLVLRITRNHEDAEDCVQDAILKAYANLPQFQRRSKFSTWIGRIAINEALMRLRKHKVMKRVPLEDAFHSKEPIDRSPELELHHDDPETLYARQEVRELMMEAAGSLQPMYQAVFYLAQVSGCTLQETAKELELSVAAVKARLHRARKQLREKLNPIGGALPC
jgi:RNA polymerase sigma-70 factor (ECF subfamily)